MKKILIFLILIIIIAALLLIRLKNKQANVNRYSNIPALPSLGQTQFNPGLAIIDFPYYNPVNNKEETITTAVWYPTKEEPKTYIYKDNEDYESRVALNAPLLKQDAPYPLLLFSHGAYGSGYNAAYFLEYLAKYGYIAVAPDYIETAPPTYEKEIAFSRIKTGKIYRNLRVLRAAKGLKEDFDASPEFILSYLKEHRLEQTSFILDKMLELNNNPDSVFYQAIDENAIGMVGHSLGGLTTLAKTGAYAGYTDRRIKTALLFSSAMHPLEDSINKITIPIMIMVGDNDPPLYGPPEVPWWTIYDLAMPPKYLLILKDATHFTFTNSGCGKTPLEQAVKTVPQVNVISQYGLAFLNKYLKKNSSLEKILSQKAEALVYYIKEASRGDVLELGEKPSSQGRGRASIWQEIRRRRSRNP